MAKSYTPQILELMEHKAIFSAGYKCILHIHSVVEEVECTKLIAKLDPKTREKKRVRNRDSQSWFRNKSIRFPAFLVMLQPLLLSARICKLQSRALLGVELTRCVSLGTAGAVCEERLGGDRAAGG